MSYYRHGVILANDYWRYGSFDDCVLALDDYRLAISRALSKCRRAAVDDTYE